MNQGRNFRQTSAFSTVELLVSFVLVAGLLVFAYFIIRANRPQYLFEEARTKLIEQNNQIVERIRVDLDAATKNWGFSATAYPGITRFPDQARDQQASPNDSDGLELIAERFSEFSIPVSSTSAGQIATGLPPDGTEDYFADLFANKFYFILSTIEQTTIAKRLGTVQSADGKFTIPVNAINFRPQDFENRVASIRAGEKVRYVFDAAKSQLLRVIPGEGGAEARTEVIAENVARFQIDYSYHDRRTGADRPKLPSKGWRLTHPEDPLYYNCVSDPQNPSQVCCNPATETCVGSQDIKDVRIVLSLKTPLASRAQQLASLQSNFSIENGELVFRGESYITPRRYGSIGGTSELVGEGLQCPINDINSRCKDECNSTFNYDPRPLPDGTPSPYPPLTGDMPYPPNWVGYRLYLSDADRAAQIPSPYCQCGNIKPGAVDVEDFQPPELLNNQSNPPVPRWTFDPQTPEQVAGNARLDQCLSHFKGCVPTGGQTFWSERYPASHLACHCVQGQSGDTPAILRDTNFPYGWTRPFINDAGPSGLKAKLDTMDPNSNHRLECWQWPICDQMAGWLFKGPQGRNTSDMGTPPEDGGGAENYNDWFDRCVCDPYSVNAAGQVSSYKTHRFWARWDYLCNLDYRAGTGPVKCANTIQQDALPANRLLKLRYSGAGATDETKQGLAVDDATVCECLKNKGYSGNQAKYNAGAFDFRNYVDGPDPGSAPDTLPWPLSQLHPSAPNYSSILPNNDGDPSTSDFPIPPLSTNYHNADTPWYAFGSTGTEVTTFNALQFDGSAWNQTQLVKDCNKEYCPIRHAWGLSIGCCVSPLHDSNQNGIEDWLSPTVLGLVQPQYQPWVNYCAEHCARWVGRSVKVKKPDGSLRDVLEIDLVREVITGTGWNYSTGTFDPIPPACGSYSSQGGSL